MGYLASLSFLTVVFYVDTRRCVVGSNEAMYIVRR